MAIVANVRLNSLVCHKESDASGHSEPYLWTSYVWLDSRTVAAGNSGGSYLQTFTPLADESGRGLFGPAGTDVQAGDSLPIPEAINRFGVILEDD